jgi:hypothetical protein
LHYWTEVYAVDSEGSKFSPVLCRESDFTKYVVIHEKFVPVLRYGKTLIVGYPGRILSSLSASSLSGEELFRFTKDLRRNMKYLNIDSQHLSGILNSINGSASEEDAINAEQRDREIHLHMAQGVEGTIRASDAIPEASIMPSDPTPLELKAQIMGKLGIQNKNEACKLKGWQGHQRVCTCGGRLSNCKVRNWKPHMKKHHQAQVPKTSGPRCRFVAFTHMLSSHRTLRLTLVRTSSQRVPHQDQRRKLRELCQGRPLPRQLHPLVPCQVVRLTRRG